MSGAQLRTGNLREYTALGAAGRQVYTAAPQLRATIKRMVGPEQADMLALPQINENGDTIAWYAPFDGISVPWSAATEDERAPARLTLQQARQNFLDHAQQLKENGTSSQDAEMFARMLPLAIHIPDESHIYLVDGKPVISFWGFDPLDAPPDVDVIRDLRPPAAPAAPQEVPRPAPPPVAPVVAAVEASRPWWRWLLWLLPLLLLLLLLLFFLFGLKGCESLPLGLGFDDKPPAIENPQPDPAEAMPPGRTPDETTPQEQLGERVPLPREDSELWGGDRLIVPDGTTTYHGDGPPHRPPEGDLIYEGPNGQATDESGQTRVPDQGTTTDPNALPAAQPDQTTEEGPPPDGTTTIPPDLALPGTSALPPPDAAAQEAPRGEDLVIPQESLQQGDTDFLNGRWRSHSGLMDRERNTPLKVEFALKDGKGVIRIYRQDGSVCEGDMSASTQGGTLVFDQTSVATCPDGRTFNKIRVECTPDSSGKAVCKGINADDGTSFHVGITR